MKPSRQADAIQSALNPIYLDERPQSVPAALKVDNDDNRPRRMLKLLRL